MRRLLPLALLIAGAAAAAPAAAAPVLQPGCAWLFQLGGAQVNLTYPDAGARYWGTTQAIPPGGQLEIRGRFPHARYFSVQTYTPQTQAIDGLADAEIVPDPGSVNPYRPRADRTATRRDYTLSIVNARVPAGPRTANTIYTESADGAKSTSNLHGAGIGLRIYLPDRGRDDSGGVGLPSIDVVSADGTRLRQRGCQLLTLPDLGLQQTLAAAGEGVPAPGPGVLARNPVHWRKYTNLVTSTTSLVLDNALTGSLYDGLAGVLDGVVPTGGFFENVHTKYLVGLASREYGQVLAVRGRMARTPRTEAGQKRMGSGQLRYWSLCAFSQWSSLYDCADDEDVPRRRDRDFVVVASTAAARPDNARPGCGVAWIPLGPVPQTVLLLRHMLPDPGFAQAVQHAAVGTEQRTLGAYYPASSYYRTIADFERLGCPVR